MQSHNQELQIEVFRAGDYGPKGVYTARDLETIAADYDPRDHEAPVTIDHQQRGPAHGWVTAVRCLGDRLVATLSRLSPALLDSLRSHAFRKRSIELYRRHAGTGRPYLKAVSFLGAAAPEVKGLADPVFHAEHADTATFEEDHLQPAEAVVDFAAAARGTLMERGCWDPRWEKSGILDVFQALAGQPAAATLMSFLQSTGHPVPLGITPTADTDTTIGFAATLHGGESPESSARHAAAMEIMRMQPGLEYRDALLRLR